MIEKVKCSVVKVDYSYQREPDVKRIEKIASEWDDIIARPMILSRRCDGSLYILDSNHTRLACMKKYGDDATMYAEIYNGLSISEEAMKFTTLNTCTKKPSFGDILKSKVTMGDEFSTKYVNMLDSTGYKYSFKSNGEGIICHHALILCAKKTSLECVREAIMIAIDSWGTDDSSYFTSHTLVGLSYFVARYNYKREKVIDILKGLDIKTIKRLSADKSNGSCIGSSDTQKLGYFFQFVVAEKYNKVKKGGFCKLKSEDKA